MSLAFVTRAMMARLPAIPKLVLIVLADCSTEDGKSCASIARITRLVGCAEHELSAVLRQFKGIGLLHGEREADPSLPSRFIINVDMLDRLAILGMWRRLVDDRGAA